MKKIIRKGKKSGLTSKALAFVGDEVSKKVKEEVSKKGSKSSINHQEDQGNSKSANHTDEEQSSQEEDYEEEEDSTEEGVSKVNEDELEAMMNSVKGGKRTGLKAKEKKGGTGLKYLNMGGEMAANKSMKKAEKSTGASEDPKTLANFLEGFDPSSVKDLGFNILSKLIIDKTVGEVPERYKFIAKVATTIAVNGALTFISGGVVGGGISMTSIKLDALKKQLQEVNKKLDTIIEEPMKTAGDHIMFAMVHIEAGDYEDSLPEIREAINNSIKAMNYIKGDRKYIGGMVTCTRYLALCYQLMEKYDKEHKVFLPYDILPMKKKNKIKIITEKHLDTLIAANNQTKKKVGRFRRKQTKIEMEVQHHDVVDDFARQQFQFLVPPGSKIPAKYLPAGHEDAVIYNVHKKVTRSEKHLGSLLLMWRNEEETHFRVIDGDKLLEFPINENEEIDISMSKAETLMFFANDGSKINPTSLNLEEEYPNILEDWEERGRDDCLKIYNACHQIHREAPVNKKNKVLWEAAKNGDIGKITYTINIGAEVDSLEPAASKFSSMLDKSIKGSALHYAAEAGHKECLQQLLELGADPDVEDEFVCTPLHVAARNGHLKIVELLCEAGANVLAEIGNGKTALDMAKDAEIKEYLVMAADAMAEI